MESPIFDVLGVLHSVIQVEVVLHRETPQQVKLARLVACSFQVIADQLMVWVGVAEFFQHGAQAVDGDLLFRELEGLGYFRDAACVYGSDGRVDQCAFNIGQANQYSFVRSVLHRLLHNTQLLT